MSVLNFRNAYEFDPEAYSGQGAGGLLGRLLALQTEQSRFQPFAGNGGRPSSLPSDPNFRQLARMPNDAPLPMPGPAAPHAVAPAPPLAIQQTEADQAQQAREAAAARLVRGVRNLTRAEAPPPDPIDIAKSTGIGLVNGAVNAVGLGGDLLTGFGYLPNNLVFNRLRRMTGYSDLPTDAPDWIRDRFSAEPIRHWVERNTFGEFYRPKTRAGRFAETIGEMVPMVLGGEAAAVRLGAKTASAARRELPGTLAKHAVAPGIAVQALEEALPDSNAGQVLQKAYPVLRRGLPAVLAAKRYLSRRVVPH
jgi:hypothetical protein